MKRFNLLAAGAAALATLALLARSRSDAATQPHGNEAEPWDHHYADLSQAHTGPATVLLWAAGTGEPVLSEVNETEIRELYDLRDGHGPRIVLPTVEYRGTLRPFIIELWQDNQLLLRRCIDRDCFEFSWNG